MTIEELARQNHAQALRFMAIAGPAANLAQALALTAPDSCFEHYGLQPINGRYISLPLAAWLTDMSLDGSSVRYQNPIVFTGDDPDRFLIKTAIHENGGKKHLILEMLFDRGQLVRLRETRNPCEALSET